MVATLEVVAPAMYSRS